jgi:hypothetical protein
MFAPILRQGLLDVVLLIGEVASLVTADVPLVAGLRLDQLSLRDRAVLLEN